MLMHAADALTGAKRRLMGTARLLVRVTGLLMRITRLLIHATGLLIQIFRPKNVRQPHWAGFRRVRPGAKRKNNGLMWLEPCTFQLHKLQTSTFYLMTAQETSIFESGQRVGLAVAPYRAELADFPPLLAADAARAELVTAIAAEQTAQDAETTPSTTDKDTARENMALATATLSARAVGYALATGQLGLKQAFTLSYADVHYGEATEDVNHIRNLVQAVQALPAQVRAEYRLTDAVIQAPADAADAFEAASDTQTDAKAAPRLATRALPELLGRLGAALRLMDTLLKGQRTDPDPKFRWAELYNAFAEANKRRGVAAKRRTVAGGPRIVRTLPVTAASGQPLRLANTNYGPAYTLTVENRAATTLLLWMAQKDGAKTTPLPCAAGAVTVLTRADLGPDTARYLTGQFEGEQGGSATVVVRRVV